MVKKNSFLSKLFSIFVGKVVRFFFSLTLAVIAPRITIMIKLIVTATFLVSINLFSQMESNDIGWASFYNEASTEFSEQFQTEMSNQLMDKFNAMVEIENFAQNKGFILFIGMTELKTIYQDGYAFTLVEVISPNSFSKTITAYWRSEDNKKITKSNSVNSEKVEFGWCADFEKEFFRSFAKENVITQINGIDLKFKFVADFQLFPDLTISYEFTTPPTQQQLEEIKTLHYPNHNEAYISELIEYEGKYHSMFDFHSTDPKGGIKQIEQFILNLNANEVGKVIKSVTIN